MQKRTFLKTLLAPFMVPLSVKAETQEPLAPLPPFKVGHRVWVKGPDKNGHGQIKNVEAIVKKAKKFTHWDPPYETSYSYGLVLLFPNQKPYLQYWFEQEQVEGRPGTKEEGWKILNDNGYL